MSSSTSNSSLARSRSLRSNTLNLKHPSPLNPQPITPAVGPSNVDLFLANLRLLELDLRDDWPGITPVTFSTKDGLQNQKKRIQCVEWALYQLFALWDPEETINKLQPFFPPLEPLQSLNLRAALFRCLDQAKKNGVLGRDTVLRKTMLDECKGERLEEVLAVFSNATLKKVLQDGRSEYHEAIAQQLAFENFSYNGERTVLSALILSHKASLGSHLRRKEDVRARYRDFADLLNLNDRRIARRHEQLKQTIEERGSQDKLSENEVTALQDEVQKNWSGSNEWLETILCGDSRSDKDALLSKRFDRVWRHVENGSIGDIEERQNNGLLKQLDARVRDQENRLARWQDFWRTLSKAGPAFSSQPEGPASSKQKKIDLEFNRHEDLQIGRSDTKDATVGSSSISLDEYTRLIENMRSELANVGKPQVRNMRPPKQGLRSENPHSVASLLTPKYLSPSGKDEEWSSASDTDADSPVFNATKSTSQTPPSEVPTTEPRSREALPEVPFVPRKSSPSPNESNTRLRRVESSRLQRKPANIRKDRSPSPPPPSRTPPPIATSTAPPSLDPESDQLADQILNSVSAASPSPKKTRPTLSLADRTRLSMSRTTHSQFSDLHDDIDSLADLPRLSIRPKLPNRASSSASEEEKHAGLIERTRKSMAGFEAAQKRAQVERRRSVKDAKKKQRESSYFPRVEEEVVATPSIDAQELIEGDPDYEDVFKSRPKIKTSPTVSPTRFLEDETED